MLQKPIVFFASLVGFVVADIAPDMQHFGLSDTLQIAALVFALGSAWSRLRNLEKGQTKLFRLLEEHYVTREEFNASRKAGE